MPTPKNILAFDLTFQDTLLRHLLLHEFKDTLSLPGLSYSKTIGLVTFTASESDGIVTLKASVLGETVWSKSIGLASTYRVDEEIGTGSIKGEVTIS